MVFRAKKSQVHTDAIRGTPVLADKDRARNQPGDTGFFSPVSRNPTCMGRVSPAPRGKPLPGCTSDRGV